jgi:hypothetical protein
VIAISDIERVDVSREEQLVAVSRAYENGVLPTPLGNKCAFGRRAPDRVWNAHTKQVGNVLAGFTILDQLPGVCV